MKAVRANDDGSSTSYTRSCGMLPSVMSPVITSRPGAVCVIVSEVGFFVSLATVWTWLSTV